MIKDKIIVPRGIRYIGEWKDFCFSNFPSKCIINKQLPGCGFTEYCINGPENVILCSPRKMLLENKKGQHENDVYLVVNEMDKDPDSDKDISKDTKPKEFVLVEEKKDNSEIYERLYREIDTYTYQRYLSGLPAKILVTYDSYRIVKDILEKLRIFERFVTVVDEFQSILHDARFKSNTEMRFMEYLKQSPTAYFVSATPMMDEYLEMLDEFKDLPYYELDWEVKDPSRIIRPDLKVLTMKSVGTKAEEIIKTYKEKHFEEIVVLRDGIPTRVISDEAVFYVNSVNHIISIIKKNELIPEECNILCSNTPENLKKIKRKLGKEFTIGDVPLKGVKPKMFTFCTRTVYLGADFYSLCARSFIFSDSNSDCLAVDISEDLPQILGRQRLFDNPWKNNAVFFYRVTADYKDMTGKDFQEKINNKRKVTENLLIAYEDSKSFSVKHDLAKTYQNNARAFNYNNDYVAVNKVADSFGNIILKPVLNNLVLVNEIRAFKIQQIDYKDRFSVFSTVHNTLTPDDIINQEVFEFLSEYNQLVEARRKLIMLCEYGLSNEAIQIVLGQISDGDYIKSYYLSLGPEKLKALGYKRNNIERELGIVTFNQNLLISSIYSEFKVGDIWLLSDIKQRLESIYSSINYNKVAKASDLISYFEIQETMLRKEINGEKKRVKVYKLLKRKDD
jgi:hypothetical protein